MSISSREKKVPSWKGKRVVVIGAARQGTALARYLAERGAQVVMNDMRPPIHLQTAQEMLADLSIEWILGSHPLSVLDGADCVCPSGGVSLNLPLVQEALRRGIPVSNDSQMFLEAAPCRVIGITGSAGKTTTTTLVGRMAQQACQMTAGKAYPARAWVGGNIGNPLINKLNEIKPDDLAILELSSFQLEIMSRSPQIAAILNITPNHLDRHVTMEAYTNAKAHILDYQEKKDKVILGRQDPGAWGLVSRAQSEVWSFGLERQTAYPGTFIENNWLILWNGHVEERVLHVSEVHLRGEHNLLNVLAACTISAAAGLPSEAMRAGIMGFMGVPHRLEFIRTWRGAHWFNDSKATAPEESMAAIRSFDSPIVLLAGGRDKDLPWDHFADLVRQRVDHLVLFGEAAEKIRQAVGPLKAGGKPYTLRVCKRLQDAVRAAAEQVEIGDVVLLSPGGTSFDEFRDFEERGEAYRKWVLEL
jgi:UDP-N-acetylmuramoylalanine--D-glutamate ligase